MRHATADSRFHIGTATFSAMDQTAFEADTYTQVSDITDLGEFGLSAEVIEFTPIAGHRTRTKGTNDYGTMDIVVHRNADDPGQQAMIAAAQVNHNYAFKVELTDAPSASGTPSIYYFVGEVMSARNTLGEANNPVTTTFTVAVNAKPILVDPAS